MKTKSLLFFIFAATLFAGGTTITVIFNTAPTTPNVLWLFYISLFVTLFGLLFLILFIRSYITHRIMPPWQETAGNLRLSILVGLFMVLLLSLRAYRLLTTPTLLALSAAFILANIAWTKRLKFLSKRQS